MPMGERKKNSRKKIAMEGFHTRLKVSMERKLYSQLGLSKILDVKQPTIHYWLKGSDLPRKYVAQKLAWTLGVSYEWLMHGVGSAYGFEQYPIEEFWSSFPERLAYLLWRRDMNVIQLQDEVGKATVNMWLDKIRTPTEIDYHFLANYFNCDKNWLMHGKFLPKTNFEDELTNWRNLNYRELLAG
jgi:hypothetical protein